MYILSMCLLIDIAPDSYTSMFLSLRGFVAWPGQGCLVNQEIRGGNLIVV